METPKTNLIYALDRQCSKRRMTDRKFSKQVLGISPAYWSLLKAGKRRLSPNLAVFFMQKLPEITPEVRAFIMRQGKDGDNEKTVPETAGGKPLRLVGTRKGSKQPQIT